MQINLSLLELIGLIGGILAGAVGFVTFWWVKYASLKTQIDSYVASNDQKFQLYLTTEGFRTYMNGFRTTIEEGVREMAEVHARAEKDAALLEMRITTLEENQG